MDIKSRITASIWPWGTQTPEQMELAAKEVSEIGYTLFESTKDAIYAFDMDINAYREVLKKYNIKPVSFYFHLPSPEEADSFFVQIDKEMEFIADLGVKLISLQATWGRPEGGEVKQKHLEAESELFIRFAKKSITREVCAVCFPQFWKSLVNTNCVAKHTTASTIKK